MWWNYLNINCIVVSSNTVLIHHFCFCLINLLVHTTYRIASSSFGWLSYYCHIKVIQFIVNIQIVSPFVLYFFFNNKMKCCLKVKKIVLIKNLCFWFMASCLIVVLYFMSVGPWNYVKTLQKITLFPTFDRKHYSSEFLLALPKPVGLSIRFLKKFLNIKTNASPSFLTRRKVNAIIFVFSCRLHYSLVIESHNSIIIYVRIIASLLILLLLWGNLKVNDLRLNSKLLSCWEIAFLHKTVDKFYFCLLRI